MKYYFEATHRCLVFTFEKNYTMLNSKNTVAIRAQKCIENAFGRKVMHAFVAFDNITTVKLAFDKISTKLRFHRLRCPYCCWVKCKHQKLTRNTASNTNRDIRLLNFAI